MINDVLRRGVELSLTNHLGDNSRTVEITSAIAESALFECESGSQLLTVDPVSHKLIQYDILKAVFAAAGVLGATIPLVTGSLGIASVLAGIGALGALQGLTQPLPKTCAQVVLCLLPKKKMSVNDLRNEFKSVYDGQSNISDVELDRALERLEQIGSIYIREHEVKLIERVLVRC